MARTEWPLCGLQLQNFESWMKVGNGPLVLISPISVGQFDCYYPMHRLRFWLDQTVQSKNNHYRQGLQSNDAFEIFEYRTYSRLKKGEIKSKRARQFPLKLLF